MDNHKLSIIIPCYNSAKTLEEALTSACAQELSIPFEIVMVDDNSEDNTRELMKKLAGEYKNIRYFFHDTNKGGGATRNTAVAKSTGDLIFCLDSDDILTPGMLGKMVNMLLEKNVMESVLVNQ